MATSLVRRRADATFSCRFRQSQENLRGASGGTIRYRGGGSAKEPAVGGGRSDSGHPHAGEEIAPTAAQNRGRSSRYRACLGRFATASGCGGTCRSKVGI